GGERQRVAIARAFLADAPVLILDEATSSLDSESEVLIQQAMERLIVGRTTLVVAHRLSTVRALDRLIVLDKGRVIEEGSHDALIRLEGGVYRRLFERQALELAKGLIEQTGGTVADWLRDEQDEHGGRDERNERGERDKPGALDGHDARRTHGVLDESRDGGQADNSAMAMEK
ncbi:ATP-binding cassette domain-containing protein, partial [Burkholderia pseudomallei]